MNISNKMRLGVCAGAFVVLLSAAPALAQEAPPPHKAPRTPVNRQALTDSTKTAASKAAALQSREITGTATIIDGEHLRINDIDLRLFGVVPPQLSATFGPQARGVLDEAARGQNVTCHVRDRDHDGRFLATCLTASKTDLALELLKHGLAVTARGSLQPTELALPYQNAEQTAQAQKIGLWSLAIPAANAPAAALAAVPVPAPKPENPNVPPLPSELKKEEKPAAEKTIVPAAPAAATVVAAAPKAEAPVQKIYVSSESSEESGVASFFARYQLLITGLVMLTTAFGIMLALVTERRRDKREEMKAVAAALRGELSAARAVCQARLKSWDEMEEKNFTWPRIRSTLYQAYVGKLGWLGAVLARQIASIYGQASDYAAYFNPNNPSADPRSEGASKRKALQTLVQHIEEVLPRLAGIEQSGQRPRSTAMIAAPSQSGTPIALQSEPVHSQEVAIYDAGHQTEQHQPQAPLWNIVQRFGAHRRYRRDEPLPDYTALIEEEMARMSEEDAQQPSNVTKMRSGG